MRLPDARHFDGTLLWGDDFDEVERNAWFADEENAYQELYASNPDYEYEYETVNRLLGFSHLPSQRRFRKVLGLGSAYGDELVPIQDRVEAAVIVESSESYAASAHLTLPVEFRRADPSGRIPLADGEVDLVVCLGVLHHLPNVRAVTQELGRVVEPGGCALIREPIVSMGDWTKSRPGLTPRERGIPRRLLIDYVTEAGFEVVAERPCFFPGSRVISKVVRRSQFEHPILVRLDALLSRATLWNYRYHATTSAQKIRPTSTFLVLRRV